MGTSEKKCALWPAQGMENFGKLDHYTESHNHPEAVWPPE
jgi:hypothetical protein